MESTSAGCGLSAVCGPTGRRPRQTDRHRSHAPHRPPEEHRGSSVLSGLRRSIWRSSVLTCHRRSPGGPHSSLTVLNPHSSLVLLLRSPGRSSVFKALFRLSQKQRKYIVPQATHRVGEFSQSVGRSSSSFSQRPRRSKFVLT